MKYLILDSGPLINLTQNGLTDIFKKLATEFQGEFIIPDTVKFESIDHPIKIKRFEWGALRIQQLLNDEIIRLPEDEDIVSEKELSEKANEVMSLANNALSSEGKPIHLIERGEAECMALSLILSKKGIENAVVIDERTARMLCENAQKLKELMESKLETKIELNEKNTEKFNGIKVIRSTELMYLANKNRLMDGGRKALEAILYALKFGGCSISEKEVEIMKNL